MSEDFHLLEAVLTKGESVFYHKCLEVCLSRALLLQVKVCHSEGCRISVISTRLCQHPEGTVRVFFGTKIKISEWRCFHHFHFRQMASGHLWEYVWFDVNMEEWSNQLFLQLKRSKEQYFTGNNNKKTPQTWSRFYEESVAAGIHYTILLRMTSDKWVKSTVKDTSSGYHPVNTRICSRR